MDLSQQEGKLQHHAACKVFFQFQGELNPCSITNKNNITTKMKFA